MEEQKKEKQKISNVEWGLLIGALALTDLVQAGLDLLAIGVFINRLIDIFVALSLLLIFWLKGIRGMRIYGSVAAGFGLELIPVVDALPLWTLDGFFAFSQDKIASSPLLQKAVGIASKAAALAGPEGAIAGKMAEKALLPKQNSV